MPMYRSTTLARAFAAQALLAASSSLGFAADVLVVDAAGAGAFTSIQAAVNSAADGDVVLVRAGSYSGDVIIDACTLTLVGEGQPQLVGHLIVQNLDTPDVVNIAGLVVEPPQDLTLSLAPYIGALDVRNARGRVRVQDCNLRGADFEGRSPYWSWPWGNLAMPEGGAGVLAVMSNDLALVDCVVRGGDGAPGIIVVSGYGGDGIVAEDVTNLTVVRTVARGGTGGGEDDPGYGGAGVRLVGATTLHLAYSALIGGSPGCWGTWGGTPNWWTYAGPGLFRGAASTTYDFEGLFFGGTPVVGACVTPGGSYPGLPNEGSGVMLSLHGFPNTLNAPTIVREGLPWSVEVVGPVGETAHLLHSTGTGFGFRPALEQPRLLGALPISLVGGGSLIPGTQRVQFPQGTFQLPASADADVTWLQAVVGPAGGPATFSSARFVVRLDAAF
jgi:hypothetical protein